MAVAEGCRANVPAIVFRVCPQLSLNTLVPVTPNTNIMYKGNCSTKFVEASSLQRPSLK